MHIITAMDCMQKTLTAAQAPHRQLRGVESWRVAIVSAVAMGAAYPAPRGLYIDDAPRLSRSGWTRPPQVRFLYGEPTHRAWLALCGAIVHALNDQQMHAAGLNAAWAARAAAAQLRSTYEAAVKCAAHAAEWRDRALLAALAGSDLTHQEDAIMRPVGVAIAAAGGITEVARDKHYHQAERFR